MTDNTDQKAEGQGEKKRPSRTLLIIGAVVLVLVAAGAAGVILLGNKAGTTEAKEEKKQTAFVDIKEMIVGMSADPAQASSGIQRFMKIHIMLEVADSKRVPAIQLLVPRIEDLFQVYLRELRPADLQGSAAIFRLKEELLRRVNLAVGPEHVEAVLIKELLLQ